MSMNDPLAAVLSNILNSERVGKQTCVLKQNSKVIKNVLKLLNERGYLGTFEEIGDNKGGVLVVNLLRKINKCGAIKPRFSVKKDEYELYEKRFLPAKNFGLLIISTPEGMLAHEEARKRGLGGKLIAYCY